MILEYFLPLSKLENEIIHHSVHLMDTPLFNCLRRVPRSLVCEEFLQHVKEMEEVAQDIRSKFPGTAIDFKSFKAIRETTPSELLEAFKENCILKRQLYLSGEEDYDFFVPYDTDKLFIDSSYLRVRLIESLYSADYLSVDRDLKKVFEEDLGNKYSYLSRINAEFEIKHTERMSDEEFVNYYNEIEDLVFDEYMGSYDS